MMTMVTRKRTNILPVVTVDHTTVRHMAVHMAAAHMVEAPMAMGLKY